MIVQTLRIRGTHWASFRRYKWANVIGVKMVTPGGDISLDPRKCYEVQYGDGCIDYIPISDSNNFEIVPYKPDPEGP